jgi:hypothetical protein
MDPRLPRTRVVLTYWKVLVGLAVAALVVWGAYVGGTTWWRKRQDLLNGERAERSGPQLELSTNTSSTSMGRTVACTANSSRRRSTESRNVSGPSKRYAAPAAPRIGRTQLSAGDPHRARWPHSSPHLV